MIVLIFAVTKSEVLQKMASVLWKQSGRVWRTGQGELCVITLLSRGMLKCPTNTGAISKFSKPEGWRHVSYWRSPKITKLAATVQNIVTPSHLASEFGAPLIMTRFWERGVWHAERHSVSIGIAYQGTMILRTRQAT